MRVHLFGCPVDILSMKETVEIVHNAMQEGQHLHHVAINAAKLVNMNSNRELAEDVRRSEIVGIDGMAIILALRFFGWRNLERVTGIDLMNNIFGLCVAHGFRPYLLGARPNVLQTAANNIRESYPEIEFAGLRNGYFTPEDEAEIVEEIRSSGADCLFVGIPTPFKERFLAKYGKELGVSFIMGVGGSFDVWAGHVNRAPVVMQRYGLEWLYRTYQEPRRMWWRYARTNSIFAGMLLRGYLKYKLWGISPIEPPAPSNTR